ncbi:thioredoxin [Paludicola sp. MB14-C6]|uniref:thioredoxin n=1 Tax=Paludihabitans sp. MB14-C6 TaxID=3070656 RepID=UPI0027DD5E93|nr:thioredoxin [Paludicola sp. MB14-C6]WMJ23279.1 thioredoxin [Paludicola sp. MB14-C6]
MSLLKLTNDTFTDEVLESEIPVLVDFYADWCGPCKMLAPIMDEIAKEYASTVKVVKLNIDEVTDVASEYGVMSIPTLILFKNGKAENQLVGVRPKETIIKEFNLE